MRDGFGRVGLPLGLGRLELATGFREPGPRFRADAAAAGVDEIRHRLDPGLGGEQRLVERPGEAFGGFALLGHAGQQPIQVGVGLGQPGEGAQRIRGAVAVGVGDGLGRRVAGGAELRGLWGVRLLQLRGGRIDAGLDVGDRRRQRGDRAIDVGGGAVDGVQQRTGLPQRGFRGADRVDQPDLIPGRPGRQVCARW